MINYLSLKLICYGTVNFIRDRDVYYVGCVFGDINNIFYFGYVEEHPKIYYYLSAKVEKYVSIGSQEELKKYEKFWCFNQYFVVNGRDIYPELNYCDLQEIEDKAEYLGQIVFC